MDINASLTEKAMKRISSGLRINSAADDPAGLGISEGMKAQIRGLEQASRNAQDGISLIQLVDGALNEASSILQRMRELTVKASNGTYSDEGRKYMQIEFNQLTSEIDKIGNDTEYNTIKALTGNADKNNGANIKIILQVGANSNQNNELDFENMTAKGIGIAGAPDSTATSKDGKTTAKFSEDCIKDSSKENSNSNESALDITDRNNASCATKIIDDAINSVSSFRAILGSNQNVLQFRIEYLDNTRSNLMEAQSKIEDADIAKEIINYVKHNCLEQAGQSMLSQVKNNEYHIVNLLKSL